MQLLKKSMLIIVMISFSFMNSCNAINTNSNENQSLRGKVSASVEQQQNQEFPSWGDIQNYLTGGSNNNVTTGSEEYEAQEEIEY